MGIMTNRVVKFIRKGDDSVTYAIVSNVDILKLPTGAFTLNDVVWHIVKSAGNSTTAINTTAAAQAEGLTIDVKAHYGTTIVSLQRSFTITGLTRIVTAIDLYVKKSGVTVASKSIPVVADGEPGTPGQDAISVDVTPSSAILRSVCMFEIKVTATKGSGKMIYDPTNANAVPRFSCPVLGSGFTVTGFDNLWWEFETRDNGYTFVYKMMYTGGSIDGDLTINVTVYPDGVTPVEIPKVVHIANALKGDRGPALRGPQMWSDCANGYNFQSGADTDAYKDVVIYNNYYYSCVKSHTKNASNYPGSTADTNNGYWQLGDSVEMVATKILLASYALVKNLGVECIDMRDGEGNILFQAKDGNVTCKTGTFENITVKGDITANSMTLKTCSSGTLDGAAIIAWEGGEDLTLPPLPEGAVKTIEVMRIGESRSWFSPVWTGENSSVKVGLNATFIDHFAQSQEMTSSCPMAKLIGFNRGGITYWNIIEYNTQQTP